MTKTDYRSLYDRDYLGHWDLDGQDVTFVISRVTGGELTAIGGRKSKKPILYFKGQEKGFISNKTNSKTIAAMYGNIVEQWVGKAITLFTSTTRSPDGGENVECIRIRPRIPENAAAPKRPAPVSTKDDTAPAIASDAAALLARIAACKTAEEVKAMKPEIAKLPKGPEREAAIETAKAMIEELEEHERVTAPVPPDDGGLSAMPNDLPFKQEVKI